ncbi:MAG: chemotaxis response regulator protein-glutamate methylesterase [Spirochaetales bacterium]|nr:MAG: chemotaxis response regulator protein-glutamate methylesterase [Spirochaetales bacterium]
MTPISVLIVDDSALMRNMVRRMLEGQPEIQVVGTAMNGQFALNKVKKLNPDLIVLDLEMPELDGIGFLKKRKELGWDMPVIILSSIAKKGAKITMKALSLGAADFISKPGGTPDANSDTAKRLVEMILGYGSAYLKKKSLSPPPLPQTFKTEIEVSAQSTTGEWPELKPLKEPAPAQIFAIGISTGGPKALREVFALLSPEMQIPIVVVQHMPAGFTAEFARSLDTICPLEVKEAAEGDILKPGRILIAPGGYHLSVEKKSLATVVHVQEGDTVNGHKPSAGVLFESVAREFGNSAVGIIMTGMGRDGSREIGSIYSEGGITIAQDEETSIVYGMPKVAMEHGYITQEAPLDKMAEIINELGKK